ncbi:MAG: NADH-quinone oxidoreductase subunit NuoE [Dehalococcoidales bacterium]|nr:MAG: NADH-quinone oxidoreductase subunit NuoE [Dehalococcoidales bacterium]
MTETKNLTKTELKKVDDIIAEHKNEEWGLIPCLQDVQDLLGYIPPPVIKRIAEGLGLFPSQVQGVVTFYEQLYTTPRGKNIVKVCRGTACHVRGGKTILNLVKQQLNLEEGETAPDLEYTLETVACIGVCALAPNIVINRDTHGHMNPKKVSRLFNKNGDE